MREFHTEISLGGFMREFHTEISLGGFKREFHTEISRGNFVKTSDRFRLSSPGNPHPQANPPMNWTVMLPLLCRPRVVGTALMLLLIGAFFLTTAPATARDRLRIVGSSTLFPFAAVVAERVAKTSREPAPVLESTGTGGGIKLFCAGMDLSAPDIVNASARMSVEQLQTCQDNGVNDIIEVKVGFDGIAIVHSLENTPMTMSTDTLYRALAAQLTRSQDSSTLIDNPYSSWRQIDDNLPDVNIEVLGPPSTSGTRAAFVEIVMDRAASSYPHLSALRKSDKTAFKLVARTLREDGAYIEAGENDNLIVQKLVANPNALGILGYSYLDRNRDKLQGVRIDGIEPQFEEIFSGNYPISRSLFFYVKTQRMDTVATMKTYVNEWLKQIDSGEDSYLVDYGLIPLPPREARLMRQRVDERQVVTTQILEHG